MSASPGGPAGPPRAPRTLLRILFWATFAYVAFVTLSPIAERPITGLPPWMERFGAFALASGLAALAYPRRRFALAAALVVAAGLLEAGQSLQPGRHGRIVDFEEKAAGVVAGSVAALGLARLIRVRRAAP